MEPAAIGVGQLVETSKRFVRRLLIIGENRLELLTVEVQEARERLLHAILLALGVAAFGLLAGITLTAAIVVWLWAYSPVASLLALTGLYAAAGIFLYRRLTGFCVTGRRFPPRSTNSERTAHVWKKPSLESVGIAKAIVDRRKRTQSRPTGSGMAGDGGRSSLGRRPGQNPRFRRFRRRRVGCRPCVIPAQKVCARGRKTLLAANPFQRRRTDLHHLAGVPLTGPGSGRNLIHKIRR